MRHRILAAFCAAIALGVGLTAIIAGSRMTGNERAVWSLSWFPWAVAALVFWTMGRLR